MQDLVNALVVSGFKIELMDELFAEKTDLGAEWWDKNKFDWDEKADCLFVGFAGFASPLPHN